MQEILNKFENGEEKYEEEWKVVIAPTRAQYLLSKMQAKILMQAIASKEKAVVFKTFIISIPFIAEFYRVKRFLKINKQLSKRAKETEYKKIDSKKFEEWKKKVYKKIK